MKEMKAFADIPIDITSTNSRSIPKSVMQARSHFKEPGYEDLIKTFTKLPPNGTDNSDVGSNKTPSMQ